MTAKVRSWRISIIALGFVFSLLGTAVAAPYLDHVVLPSLRDAQPGDVVFVKGRTLRSVVMHLLQNDLNSYTHVGIVVFVNAVCTVIHADPHGSVIVQERCDSFISRTKVSRALIYRLVTGDGQRFASRAADAAQAYQNAVIRFDDRFDLTTDDAFYCTELVWRAYLAAGIDLTDPTFASRKYLFPSDLVRSRRLRIVGH
jgi:uncharacterized protein YycO